MVGKEPTNEEYFKKYYTECLKKQIKYEDLTDADKLQIKQSYSLGFAAYRMKEYMVQLGDSINLNLKELV